MKSFENEGKAVGLIFDVSIRHCKNGRRNIDVLKKKMIEVIRTFLVDGEDSFYLYHPAIYETVTSHGDQVGAIGNYNTDGWRFNMQNAFKQSLYVLMAEPITYQKYVIFITDRIQDYTSIEKAIHIDEKEMIDSHFFLIGIDKNYDKNCLEKFKDLNNVTLMHFDDATLLETNSFLENINGQTTQHCQTCEHHKSVHIASGHNCSIPRSVRSSDAIDEQLVSIDTEQLLPTDTSGRLQSESRLFDDSGHQCQEECGSVETTECSEGS